MDDAIPAGIGDPTKADAVWKQLIGTELKVFQPVGFPELPRPKRKAFVRPHSAPDKLASSRGPVKLQAQRRPRTAATPSRKTSSVCGGGAGNLPSELCGVRCGDEARIRGMQRRTDLNDAHCEVIDAVADDGGRVGVRISGDAGKLMRVRADRLSPRCWSGRSTCKRTSRFDRLQSGRATSAGSLWLGHQPPSPNYEGPFFRPQLLKPGQEVTIESDKAAANFAAFVRAQLCQSEDRGFADGPHKRTRSMPAIPSLKLSEAVAGRRSSRVLPPKQSRSRHAYARNENGNFFAEAQWHET